MVKGTTDILETSLKGTSGEHALKIYPNPVSRVLHYVVSDYPKELSVYSLTGEKLIVHIPDGTNRIHVNGLQSGMYLLLARTDKQTHAERFTVIKD